MDAQKNSRVDQILLLLTGPRFLYMKSRTLIQQKKLIETFPMTSDPSFERTA